MKDIASILYPLGHFSLILIEWVLLFFSILFYRHSASLATIVLPIVLASISYDNLVLWGGRLIGEGELLENLSELRFLLHYLVVPLFIVVGVELAHRSGARWAKAMVRALSWVLAIGLAGWDVVNNFVGLELVPTTFAGILRYEAESAKVPVVTIVVNIFVLLVGIGIWIRMKGKWPWIFIGTLIALIGNSLPSSSVGTLPGSASECIMALSLLVTEQRIQVEADEAKSFSVSAPLI